MKQKLFTLLLAVTASIGTMFASTKIGDLYYNLDATHQTAEVTSQNNGYPYWSTTIKTATIPASVTYNSVTYSVTSIGEIAFFDCYSLTSITIPNSVTSIGEEAFYGCDRLTSVTIPNSVTSIGKQAFYGCSGLTSVTIGNGVVSIGNYAFAAYGAPGDYIVTSINLTSLIIGNSVTTIGNGAFAGSTASLSSINIPNSVTDIGDGAFKVFSESAVKDIIIGSGVEYIGKSAFERHKKVRSITCKATTPPLCSENCFKDINVSIPLNVPAASIEQYKLAPEWKEFYNVQAMSTEDIDNIQTNTQNSKTIKDGQIYIICGDKIYTLQGQEVK